MVGSGKWLTTGEAAERLGTSDETIRRWCVSGEVFEHGEVMKTVGRGGRGGHWRVLAVAVERIVAEQLGE